MFDDISDPYAPADDPYYHVYDPAFPDQQGDGGVIYDPGADTNEMVDPFYDPTTTDPETSPSILYDPGAPSDLLVEPSGGDWSDHLYDPGLD